MEFGQRELEQQLKLKEALRRQKLKELELIKADIEVLKLQTQNTQKEEASTQKE